MCLQTEMAFGIPQETMRGQRRLQKRKALHEEARSYWPSTSIRVPSHHAEYALLDISGIDKVIWGIINRTQGTFRQEEPKGE